MTKNKMKIWESALLIALCISLCTGTWAQGRQQSISSSLVRLHVIASSDDEREQKIKLEVRDRVLEYLSPLLKDAENSGEAREIISKNMYGIASAAASASKGRRVTVSLGRERYPLREYKDFALPGGEYESLRVILGEGEGRNWWCVVFPPLCSGAVSCGKAREVMNPDNFALITESEGYELRFRGLELWGELVNFVDSLKDD
jgi:stage II sporulation protein R